MTCDLAAPLVLLFVGLSSSSYLLHLLLILFYFSPMMLCQIKVHTITQVTTPVCVCDVIILGSESESEMLY